MYKLLCQDVAKIIINIFVSMLYDRMSAVIYYNIPNRNPPAKSSPYTIACN